jgi:hypothetical protein
VLVNIGQWRILQQRTSVGGLNIFYGNFWLRSWLRWGRITSNKFIIVDNFMCRFVSDRLRGLGVFVVKLGILKRLSTKNAVPQQPSEFV